ncbi:MAG: hypothetical protein GF411_18575 [Candidatus Lokiarchaeota archaeon]|nr:hypothetical protein [Candidatus Lokiarchaeota archaeon]
MTYERNKQYKADLLPVIEQHLSLIRESGLFDDHPDRITYDRLEQCAFELLKRHDFGVRMLPSCANASVILIYECIVRYTSIKFRPKKKDLEEIFRRRIPNKGYINHFGRVPKILLSDITSCEYNENDSIRELIILLIDSLNKITEQRFNEYLRKIENLALTIGTLTPSSEFRTCRLAGACVYLAHRYRIGKERIWLTQNILSYLFGKKSTLTEEVRFIEEHVDIFALRNRLDDRN